MSRKNDFHAGKPRKNVKNYKFTIRIRCIINHPFPTQKRFA